MYQNSVKRIFSAWGEKGSSRPQLGINCIPGVFQPFIPELNLHLCLCHPECNLSATGATGICSLRNMLVPDHCSPYENKMEKPFFSKADFWKVLTSRVFHHIWTLPDTSESHIQKKPYVKSLIRIWVSRQRFVLPRCSTSKALGF